MQVSTLGHSGTKPPLTTTETTTQIPPETMKKLTILILMAAALATTSQADVRDRDGIRVILKVNGNVQQVATTLAIPQSRILDTLPQNNLLVASLTWPQIYQALASPRIRQAYYDWPVNLDRTVESTGTDNSRDADSWGLDRIDQRESTLDGKYNMTTSGDGVNAYVIDTGIRTTHKEFEGRASSDWTAYGEDAEDALGHGTHVAGTIGGKSFGVAPKVKLHAIKVLDDSGWGYDSDIISGIEYVAQNAQKPAVANMSLGGTPHELLDNAVRNLVAAGVSVAVAAGNESADASTSSPARVEEALTVGSSDKGDGLSYFSNYGNLVDLFAPGGDITSATADSDEATATWSGTSMAAPHVAGVVALFLENNKNASPDDVASKLLGEATKDSLSEIQADSPNLLLYSLFNQNENQEPEPQPEPEPTPEPEQPENPETPLLPEPEEPIIPEPIVESHEGILKQFRFKKIVKYKADSGFHEGELFGPENTDFDLYFLKRERRAWKILNSSINDDSMEYIGQEIERKGKYLWLGVSFEGKGRYYFDLTKHEQVQFEDPEMPIDFE